MTSLHEALERAHKFDEPTAEELGLPSDPGKLYALEFACAAPRAAWRAYYAAIGYFNDEANARQRAREVRAKVNPKRRGKF